ncbi:MAG: Holliday junction branch migration protein RuvA [Eubacteriaceae bacterium]|jgi:Holliday junction DNA helicase RuvA
MYNSIKGTLEEVFPDRVIIDTPVFGYKVFIPASALTALPAVGSQVRLLLCPVFREDDVILFGFTDERNRELFEMVMKVSGIGPKTALAILSEFTADELIRAVTGGDVKALTRAQGIGKKGAERMILELKDKFGKMPVSAGTGSGGGASERQQQQDSLFNEAADALQALGFSWTDASSMISAAMEDGLSLEELIRRALAGGV